MSFVVVSSFIIGRLIDVTTLQLLLWYGNTIHHNVCWLFNFCIKCKKSAIIIHHHIYENKMMNNKMTNHEHEAIACLGPKYEEVGQDTLFCHSIHIFLIIINDLFSIG